MKNRLKYYFLLTSLIVISNIFCTYSQTPASNMMKYWFYRNRLQYFVVPGTKIGESQVAGIRNLYQNRSIDYGQHSEYQGPYIGVLATEYYLLKENNQPDAITTYSELEMAINAFEIFWDGQAEPFWDANPPIDPQPVNPVDINGFFIRGNVPCDFLNKNNVNGYNHGYTIDGKRHFDLLNKGLEINTNDYSTTTHSFGKPRGLPGYVDNHSNPACNGIATDPHTPPKTGLNTPEPMSQDEAIFMLVGLSLAAELADGPAQARARLLAEKIIKYVTNLTLQNGLLPYWIYKPDDSRVPEPNGGWTYPYGLGFFASGFKISNDYLNFIVLPSLQPDIVRIPQALIWAGVMAGIGNRKYMAASLLAMGNFPALCIKNNTTANNWETYYLLLWEVLNNHSLLIQNNQDDLETKAFDQLVAGPGCGTYFYEGGYHCTGPGWATSDKWTKTVDEQNNGDPNFRGNYSGLDYMLLYNLYHIKTKDVSPYYVNYNNRFLTGTLPFKYGNFEVGTNAINGTFVAFNSITSTQVIDIQTVPPPGQAIDGYVVYKAQDYISLLPGFHAKAGCFFHAYIGEIDCEGGSKSDGEYPDNMITAVFDSLISVPRTPYPVTLVDDTSIFVYTDTLNCPLDTISFMGITGDTVGDTYSYYWDFGNGDTSILKAPQVFYDTIGTYNLMCVITDTNEISDTVRLVIVVPTCNDSLKFLADTSHNQNNFGLNNYIASALIYLNVFPNPSNGNMQVSYNIPENTEGVFEIFDAIGRKLYSYPLSGGKNSFSISLKDGIYFYRASIENKPFAVNKIVVLK